MSPRLRSTSSAAWIQDLAMSSKTWRCRSDLVSLAERRHSCANSRNSSAAGGIARVSLLYACASAFLAKRQSEQQLAIEQLGPKLRAMMPFLQPVVAPGLEIKAAATKE